MKFYHIQTGLLDVNSYFLVDENTNEGIVIDCGEYPNKILQVAEKYNFKIKSVLLTHAHFDHVGGAKQLQDLGAKIYISSVDAEKIANGGTLSQNFNKKFGVFTPDYLIADGETLRFGEIIVKAHITKGHTDGSMIFIVGNKIYSGDTIFYHTIGRTDFPTGSMEDMKNSLKFIYSLKGEYLIYPGHNEFTTLEEEKRYNILRLL